MTNEEIRIKVAEACGWEVISDTLCNVKPDKNGDPEIEPIAPLPNYPESLDACAEFEKTLTTEQRHDYVRALRRITEAWDAMPEFTTTFATARQRCLAYLRMKGILP